MRKHFQVALHFAKKRRISVDGGSLPVVLVLATTIACPANYRILSWASFHLACGRWCMIAQLRCPSTNQNTA